VADDAQIALCQAIENGEIFLAHNAIVGLINLKFELSKITTYKLRDATVFNGLICYHYCDPYFQYGLQIFRSLRPL
jgi:hypothetical protein